ncbi:MAG: chromosome segregation SMC family protein [Candidatus Caldarchaeales archaeon]
MVYIKRLTIQGFKSFSSKRTTIDLEKGLVVITGPNGGGKSNILDAIRFALGELSAHNLRVGKMSELIHDNQQNSGAKVTLTLDNSERILPIDSSEVTITRRLDKSGESEYILNGKQVSRVELLTILSMSNIRPSGFNIVSQGSVTSIAEMSGVELRRILEDISGIGEYERKKQEAEEQLKIAEKNIAIAKAGTTEVKLRVNQLQKERNEAYRKNHVENLLSIIKSIKLKNVLDSLESELKSLDFDSTRLEEEITNIQNTRARYLEDQTRIEMERLNLSREISELDRRLKELEKIRETIRVSEIHLTSEESTIKERLRNIDLEISDLRERLRESMELKDSLSQKIQKEKVRFLTLKESLTRLTDQTNECKNQLESLKARLDELEKELDRATSKRMRLEKEIEVNKIKMEEMKNKITNIEKNSNIIVMDIIKRSRERLFLIEKIKKYSLELEKLQRDLELLNIKLDEVNSVLSRVIENEKNMSDLLREIATTGINLGNDLDEKIKNSLKMIKGVYGFLEEWIDFKDVDAWVRLELGSSGWIRSLVVEDWRIGVELAKIFSEAGLRIKIIPIESVPMRGHLKIQDVKPKTDWAKRVLALLLDNVTFCKEVKSFEKPRSKMVYPRGIILYPDGRIEVDNLTARRDSRILANEYEESIRSINLLKDVIKELHESINRIREWKSDLSERIVKIDMEKRAAEEDLGKIVKHVAENFLRFTFLDVEKIQIIREFSKIEQKTIEYIRELDEFKPIDKMEHTHLREEKEKCEAKFLNLSSKRSELEVELRESSKLFEEYNRDYERLMRQIEKIESRLNEKIGEKRSLEERLAKILNDHEKVFSDLREYNDEIEKIVSRLEAEKTRLEESTINISKINDNLRVLEAKIQETSSRRLSIAIRRSQLESEIRKIREELDTIQVYDFPIIPVSMIEELERSLNEELKSLEKINQLAPQQYEEIIENYKLRSSRIRELEEERAEILRFINWLEEEKKKTFMNTFNKVSDSFERFFSILTGGQAWLKLEDLENPLNGGVEMILRFPGKSPRSSKSASGGEKSVAAVSLLLALQGLTPADFYIFDEVDAHMDIQYSTKLAELFSEMSKKTQIIVITLKDVIAEKADQLIGVYVRNGESRIVKTKIEEVLENV